MATYLQKGDVVWIATGMTVAYEHFTMCLHGGKDVSAFDREVVCVQVKVGKQYKNRTDVSIERNRVRDYIIRAFAKLKIPMNESILDRYLHSQIKDQPSIELFIPPGHYVVTHVHIEPKGMRWVYCDLLHTSEPYKIYFWQNGWGPLVHDFIIPNGRVNG